MQLNLQLILYLVFLQSMELLIHMAHLNTGRTKQVLMKYDANGVSTAITSYIQSGDYDLDVQQGMAGDGENIMRVSRFIPDFKNLSGNAKITMFFRNYPNQAEQSDSNGPLITGPFTCNSTTTYVSTRVRGRQVSLKIENDAVNQSWRYGTLRLDIQAGGRR
jgi:hypothetical protein